MTAMAPDRIDAVVPLGDLDTRALDSKMSSSFIRHAAADRHAVPAPVAPEPRPSTDYIKAALSGDKVPDRQATQLASDSQGDATNILSQSEPRSTDEGSQESNATSLPDRVFTPTQSSNSDESMQPSTAQTTQEGQLQQLSELAAAEQQRRLKTDDASSTPVTRKRTADGEVKSPYRTHSRNTSAVSAVSTTSTMAQALKSRLSWAMYKYKNGLEEKSIDELETIMSSQSSSPVSNASTNRVRSATTVLSPQTRVHFAKEVEQLPLTSNGQPPSSSAPAKPMALAPPAPIRPGTSSGGGARANSRRNSNPHYMPSFLSNGSPRTPAQPSPLGHQSRALAITDGNMFSAVHNNREKDAVETLMFLSSPNNSANLKHGDSIANASQQTPRGTNGRHALPSGQRKALPTHRPDAAAQKAAYKAASHMSSLQSSPMFIDSPQSHLSPNRGIVKGRFGGDFGRKRGSLSLPSPLGWSDKPRREPLTEKDVLQMLDRNQDDMSLSSDDEEIQIPRHRNRTELGPS